jgi:WD40 repeat protein
MKMSYPMSTETVTHDLFVLAAEQDDTWVRAVLLPALGLPTGRVITRADFTLGSSTSREIERALANSRYTLLVLTPAFGVEDWATYGDLLATQAAIVGAHARVIPLLLRPYELPLHLDFRVRLDCTDPARWEAELARLRTLLAMPEPPAEHVTCPYPGMAAFDDADASLFFGRESEVEQLRQRLGLEHVMAVIGPSGSGKSSLVSAGLVPALRGRGLPGLGDFDIRRLVPGADPLDVLARVLATDVRDLVDAPLAAVARAAMSKRVLIVVDQFEEVFTQSTAGVNEFQSILVQIASGRDYRVVLVARADFYDKLMDSPIWPSIAQHRLEITPLNRDALREAIVRPSQSVGVHVEEALVERLLNDARGEFGALPLLQATLVWLWERRERRMLSLRAYESLGSDGQRSGLQVAMAYRADAALAELTLDQQAVARRVFLRLVQFGEGRADTRRRQTLSQLETAAPPEVLDVVLEHLGQYRLLTFTSDTKTGDRAVDLAHEALISGWPTLHEWLVDRRDAETERRRFEHQAAEWLRLEKRGGLLDEIEHGQAERWLSGPDAVELGLPSGLTELLSASRARIDAEAREREVAGQREIEHANSLAEAERRHAEVERTRADDQVRASGRLRRRLWAALATTAVAVAATIAAFFGMHEADQQRLRAEGQAHIATARQLASVARAALTVRPEAALLFAAESVLQTTRHQEPTVVAAEDVLREALATASGTGPQDVRGAALLSPDGHWSVVSSHDTFQLVDLTQPASPPRVLQSIVGQYRGATISRNSRWLGLVTKTSGFPDHLVATMWDLAAEDPTFPARSVTFDTDHNSSIFKPYGSDTLAFSPDGHWLGLSERSAVWLVYFGPQERTSPVSVVREDSDQINAIDFSDGDLLATGSHEIVRVWRLMDNLEQVFESSAVLHTEGDVWDINLRGDRWLVIESILPGRIYLADLHAPDPDGSKILLGPGVDRTPRPATNIPDIHGAISSDGRWLLTSTSPTGAFWLHDLDAADPSKVLRGFTGPGSPVNSVASSQDARFVVAASSLGNTIYRWDTIEQSPLFKPGVLRGIDANVRTLAISPDGHTLRALSSNGELRVWDLRHGTSADPRTFDGSAVALGVSPDGQWMATASARTAQVWNIDQGSPAVRTVDAKYGEPRAAAVSTGGRWLLVATTRDGGKVLLWDTSTESASAKVVMGEAEPVLVAATSADHRRLMALTAHEMRVWDLDGAADQEPVVRSFPSATELIDAGISPNGRWVVVGDANSASATLWQLDGSEPPRKLRTSAFDEESGLPGTLAISPDGRWLVRTTGFGSTWLTDAANPGSAPLTLNFLNGSTDARDDALFSFDGKWLATRSSGAISLRHLGPWGFPADGSPLVGPAARKNMAFSPDNRWLATADSDGSARLWDLGGSAFNRPRRLPGVDDRFEALAFLLDGHLVGGSASSPTRVWDLDIGRLLTLACRTANRNLSPRDEWSVFAPDEPWSPTCDEYPPTAP